MSRISHGLIAASILLGTLPSAARAHHKQSIPAVSVAGEGPQTVVLLTGMVGGVAGFRRLETRLLEHGQRVVIIDSYLLSIDSTDVSFAAQARRVDRVLDSLGLTGAQVVGHAHGAGVALRAVSSELHDMRPESILIVSNAPTDQSLAANAWEPASRPGRLQNGKT